MQGIPPASTPPLNRGHAVAPFSVPGAGHYDGSRSGFGLGGRLPLPDNATATPGHHVMPEVVRTPRINPSEDGADRSFVNMPSFGFRFVHGDPASERDLDIMDTHPRYARRRDLGRDFEVHMHLPKLNYELLMRAKARAQDDKQITLEEVLSLFVPTGVIESGGADIRLAGDSRGNKRRQVVCGSSHVFNMWGATKRRCPLYFLVRPVPMGESVEFRMYEGGGFTAVQFDAAESGRIAYQVYPWFPRDGSDTPPPEYLYSYQTSRKTFVGSWWRVGRTEYEMPKGHDFNCVPDQEEVARDVMTTLSAPLMDVLVNVVNDVNPFKE